MDKNYQKFLVEKLKKEINASLSILEYELNHIKSDRAYIEIMRKIEINFCLYQWIISKLTKDF